MLKLLLWAGIIYLVYRYFQRLKTPLKSGSNGDFFQQFFKPPQQPEQKPKEGEFIDYEEVSSKKHGHE
ncbi:MAG: hypothetical protein AAB316_23645 [Bacteroidota bacterium]